MRISRTTFFEATEYQPVGIVEVRSRPIWVVVLEFWFLWIHEFFSHVFWLRLPERFRDWMARDPYWGDPMEAAFHVFYSWTLNHGETIDKTATFTDLKETPGRKV